MAYAEKLSSIWREISEPWIVFRPSQILRRILQKFEPEPSGPTKFATTWGGSLWYDPQKFIGRRLLWRGMFDIVVSEVLVRLLAPGATFVDAGANIGYMSLLGARVVKSDGRVVAFEPNPDIVPTLRRNVALSAENPHSAKIDIFENALGAEPGEAMLLAPANYMDNDGIARMNALSDDDRAISLVKVETLDVALAGQRIGLLKIDVEGFELEVLRGAKELLASNRIENIIFEDHAIDVSPIPDFLTTFGYKNFALGYTLSGLDLGSCGGKDAPKYDCSPNYLATILEPAVLRSKLGRKGWSCLRPIIGKDG